MPQTTNLAAAVGTGGEAFVRSRTFRVIASFRRGLVRLLEENLFSEIDGCRLFFFATSAPRPTAASVLIPCSTSIPTPAPRSLPLSVFVPALPIVAGCVSISVSVSVSLFSALLASLSPTLALSIISLPVTAFRYRDVCDLCILVVSVLSEDDFEAKLSFGHYFSVVRLFVVVKQRFDLL
eukprot:07774_2